MEIYDVSEWDGAMGCLRCGQLLQIGTACACSQSLVVEIPPENPDYRRDLPKQHAEQIGQLRALAVAFH